MKLTVILAFAVAAACGDQKTSAEPPLPGPAPQLFSRILDERESKGLEPDEPGHIGVSVLPGVGDDPDGLLVVSLEPEGVAESLGIHVGDRITAIEWQNERPGDSGSDPGSDDDDAGSAWEGYAVTSFDGLVGDLRLAFGTGAGDAMLTWRTPDGATRSRFTAMRTEEGARDEGRGARRSPPEPAMPPAEQPGSAPPPIAPAAIVDRPSPPVASEASPRPVTAICVLVIGLLVIFGLRRLIAICETEQRPGRK